MAIDFHAARNRDAYASRDATSDWARIILSIVDPEDKRIIDVGCGGGIYTREWARLGVREARGVDFSGAMVATAIERSGEFPQLSFSQGDALATRLAGSSADIVFERALIHHLTDFEACFAEARRLLAPSGMLIVQDRTPDDIRLPGSPEHIRGYFFELFPRLLAVELGRRASSETIMTGLDRAGFARRQTLTAWETRAIHSDFDKLAADLRGRVGRSILHEINDGELETLIDYIRDRVPADQPLIEKDRWTLWWGGPDQ